MDRQAQKLEALGSLVGGVAHDFNNILTAILGNAEMLLGRLDPKSPDIGPATAIYKAGERAAALTRQLLLFNRKGDVQRRSVDLVPLVRDLIPMLKRVIRTDVRLELTLSDNTGHVFVDPTQIEQVVLNRVVNAHDAMPHGGLLAIRTERVELSAVQAGKLGLSAGSYAQASFTDEGEGMTDGAAVGSSRSRSGISNCCTPCAASWTRCACSQGATRFPEGQAPFLMRQAVPPENPGATKSRGRPSVRDSVA